MLQKNQGQYRQTQQEFWRQSPNILEYLGMTLYYTTKGEVKISIYDYINKMLTELPLDIDEVANTPVAINLFNVNPDARKLSEEISQLFHHLVAKLIYLCSRT